MPYRVMFFRDERWTVNEVTHAFTEEDAVHAAEVLTTARDVVRVQVQEWNDVSQTYRVVRRMKGKYPPERKNLFK